MDPQLIQQTYDAAVRHHQAGRLAEAESLYRRILAEHPDHADSLQMLGVLAHQAGRSDAGIRLLSHAITLNPNVAASHANLGVILAATGRTGDAIARYRRALELHPDHPEVLSNLAILLHQQNNLQEAIELLRRAVALRPDNPEFHKDLGVALREFGRVDDAIAELQCALALGPGDPVARWSLGFTRLLKGDFEMGWADLEARWEMKGLDPRARFPQPLWDASELSGRRILLWAEQGLGDTIQFARYVPLIAARGGRVFIQCQPELHRLLRTLEGVDEIIGFCDTPPPFDVHGAFVCLPRLFKTTLVTIPASVPYLHADAEASAAWRARLAFGTGMKVGLVWAGSPTHKNDAKRSLTFSDLARVAPADEVQFISLQKGPPAEQLRRSPHQLKVIDWTDELNDLADTAALVSNLDLVITVDTAVAHLAGALGKAVWVLLPFAPDWRWMLLRNHSPWYPTMRLFRQAGPGDWDSVLRQVQDHLANLAKGSRPPGPPDELRPERSSSSTSR